MNYKWAIGALMLVIAWKIWFRFWEDYRRILIGSSISRFLQIENPAETSPQILPYSKVVRTCFLRRLKNRRFIMVHITQFYRAVLLISLFHLMLLLKELCWESVSRLLVGSISTSRLMRKWIKYWPLCLQLAHNNFGASKIAPAI